MTQSGDECGGEEAGRRLVLSVIFDAAGVLPVLFASEATFRHPL